MQPKTTQTTKLIFIHEKIFHFCSTIMLVHRRGNSGSSASSTPRRPSPPRPTTHWASPSSSGSALTPPTEPPKSTASWATTPSRSSGTPSKRPRHRPMAKSIVPTAKSRKTNPLQDSQIATSPR